jgi:hypothetical protein
MLTGVPVDSQYFSLGYFQLTQYYLSIPVNVDVFINNTPFYIFSGIEIGYLVSASLFQQYYINSVKHTEIENEKNLFRPINISLNHGISYQFKLFHKVASEVQLVFSWRLFPIDKPEMWGVHFSTREFSLRYRTMF